MKSYTARELAPLVRRHGRTRLDEKRDILFFNWTCSGFTVTFVGKRLRAHIWARGDVPPIDIPTEYPCFGLVGEDGETLSFRAKCTAVEAWYEVFEAEEHGEHTVRFVKLSEAARGKLGLISLETDGEIVPCAAASKGLRIEFVGDSITCGYGNEAPGAEAPFNVEEENGWLTYGAVCGRELDAEYSMVAVSGISVSDPKYEFRPKHFLSMEELYPYSDYYLDQKLGQEPEKWDFSRAPQDVVVVNLGTNDAGAIRFYTKLDRADEEEEVFALRYYAFLERLRRLNGADTLICCTLGPMDHYLYDVIRETAERYRRETGDERTAVFKLIPVNYLTEPWGAQSHPSVMTQVRVGRELAARLRKLLGRQ